MAKTASNIVVGAPSTVIVSAYDVVEGSGVDLGATEGGVKVVYTPEFYFKKADQWLGKVGAVKTDEDMTVELVLAEASLANICYAFGYPTTAVAGGVFYAGGNATVTERTVYINGNAPAGGNRKITILKCVLVGATEINMVKNDKTVCKLMLQVLQDTSKTANQQFVKVEDSGVDVTPPTVAMTSPAEGGNIGAGTTNAITLTFTDASPIDEGTLLYGNTIMVNDIETPLSTVQKAGTISYNSATKVLTFTPTTAWATAGNNYEVIITTAVRDIAGNYLASTFYGHFVSA